MAAVAARLAVVAVAAVAGAGEMPAQDRSSPDLLFVYGTLRPSLIDAAPETPRQIVRALRVQGEATVAGLLFDLGDYPGFVRATPSIGGGAQAGSPRVVGDVLEVDASDLAALDAYEECGGPSPLYRRERVLATWRSGGEPITCWIYVACGDLSKRPAIPQGDFAAHLRSRRDA